MSAIRKNKQKNQVKTKGPNFDETSMSIFFKKKTLILKPKKAKLNKLNCIAFKQTKNRAVFVERRQLT